MKLNKQILEAIQNGIRLALDDYEDQQNTNEPVKATKDVIRKNNYVKNRLTFDSIVDFKHEITKKESLILARIVEESGIKYIPNSKQELQWFINNQLCDDADFNWVDLSNLTDLSYLFHNSGFSGDISKWNVSHITNMSYMFLNAASFNSSISSWDVSNVKNMKGMFENSAFNNNIINWNISSSCNTEDIFKNCNIFDLFKPKCLKRVFLEDDIDDTDEINYTDDYWEADADTSNYTYDDSDADSDNDTDEDNESIFESYRNRANFALDDDNEDILNQGPIKPQKETIKRDDTIHNELLNTVDLKLPSGTLWARYNIGVNPLDLDSHDKWMGDYFAWGEIEPKEVYDWNSYKWAGDQHAMKWKEYLLKYASYSDTELELRDDAAFMNTNGKFITPTDKQFKELIDNCEIKYVRPVMQENGKEKIMTYNGNQLFTDGYMFTSKINSEQLFFPCADIKSDIDTTLQNLHLNDTCNALYWTRSLYDAGSECKLNEAFHAFFSHGDMHKFVASFDRCAGLPVRGVIYKK